MVLKYHSDESILLNVNMSEHGSHSTQKVAFILCASGFTVTPPITSICLCAVFLMENMKIRYLSHEVAGDKFW